MFRPTPTTPLTSK
jgi:hypothetical protein